MVSRVVCRRGRGLGVKRPLGPCFSPCGEGPGEEGERQGQDRKQTHEDPGSKAGKGAGVQGERPPI